MRIGGLAILIFSGLVLLAAYILYGRWLEKKWKIDKSKKTPAHELYDGEDYAPAKKSVLFGYQFASIAGMSTIIGPAIAAMFGWVPVLAWILVGGIFFGAVQDFAAMYVSVRNQGKTMGYVIELYIGKAGKRLLLIFAWLFMMLMVAALADIAAETFNGFAADQTVALMNVSVASASVMITIAAVPLGLLLHKVKPNAVISAFAAVILLAGCIAGGLLYPIYLPKYIWVYIIFGYVLIVSITPVWAILRPRGYISSFLLIGLIISACAGIAAYDPVMRLPAFTSFMVEGNYMFPMLFITISSGAVSGFHGIVSAGISSKQVNNEKDMRFVSFGTMLLESFLAVIALIAVGALAVGGNVPAGSPAFIFASAVSGFLSIFGLPEYVVSTAITLAVSALALTTLDSMARAGRIVFQELFTDIEEYDATAKKPDAKKFSLRKLFANKYFAAAVTLVPAYFLSLGGYRNIWYLFGSANQLLAAFSLIICAIFIKKTGKRSFMLLIPMLFILLVTLSSLFVTILQIFQKLFLLGTFSILLDGVPFMLSVLLIILGVIIGISGVVKLQEEGDGV